MRALKGNLAVPGTPATGLQISSCAYGQPIPLLYGYDRVEPKLIWAGNFDSHGGGSGLLESGKSQTTYSVNADLLLGFNPMEGVADVWYTGSWFYIFSTVNTFNYSSVGAGTTLSGNVTLGGMTNPIAMIAGIYLAGISYSESYNDFVYPGQTNSFSLSGSGIIPLYNNAYPAPNNGAWSAISGMPYASYNSPVGSSAWSVHFPTAISSPFSICVIFYYDVQTNYPNPLPSAQLTWESELGNGGSGQPTVYPEFAGVSGQNINLGSSPVLPEWGLHTKGMFGIGYPVTQATIEYWTVGTTFTPGQTPSAGDCNPADVIFDLISSGNNVAAFGTNAVWNHGCGFSAVVYDSGGGQDNQIQYSRYGSLAVDENGPIAFMKMRNYCLAYSILVSGGLTSQTSCAQVLKDLAEIANCAPCFNGAALDFIPYCEVSNFANGANFVAPGLLFNLDRSNFLTTRKVKGKSSPNPPVVLETGLPQDNYNSLSISIKDRTGTSNNNTVLLTDSFDVSRQGPMTQGSRSWPWLQNPSMAVNAGWAVLRRNVIVERNGTYKFSLPACWSPILSLMDLVSLNEPTLSSDLIPVRITKIAENETDMTIEVEAEKFVYGASVPLPPGAGITGIVSGGGGGGGTGGQSDPGSVNTPIIFEAIPAIANQPELWMSVSGGSPIVNGIASATKVSGGSAYNAANVSVTGTGTGCILQAVIVGGVVTSLLVINPGMNYTGTPTITITDPTGAGSGASYTAVIQASIPVSYAGCLVYMSTDGGVTYNPVNSVDTATNIIGGNQTNGLVYSSNFPSHSDPDTADTLNVDLTQSQQSLSSFTTSQRDSFLSLCYLAGGGTVSGPNGTTLTIPYELLAYATATLSSANKYALPPTLRRGVYGTPVAAHNIGTGFSFLLDGTIFKIALPANLIGVTLYFKFLAFNQAGTLTQSLSNATAYSFTPSGAVGFSQQTYTISPYPTVYQGQSGGWPGIDGSSSSWTNTSDVYFPTVAATFSNGRVLNYAARDSGVAFSASAGQQVWVTIFDPNLVGEPNNVATLSCYADANQTRWNTPGYIRIGTFIVNSGGGGNGGGGGSTGSSGPYLIASYEGDPTLTSPVGGQILLTHQIPGSTILTNVTLPSGLTGSVGGCKVNPTAVATVTIKRNGSSIGTINISTGGVVTFTFSSAVTLNPNDILDFVFQATADSTLAGLWWTIAGTRS